MNTVEKLVEHALDEVKDKVPFVSVETGGAQGAGSLMSLQSFACVTGIVHKDEDNSALVELQIFNLVTQEFDDEDLALTDLYSKTFSHFLMKKGYSKKEAKALCESTQKNVRTILANEHKLIRRAHAALGWFNTQKQFVFKADRIYLSDGVIASDYIGNFRIESQGDIKVYKKMIDTCVVGQIPLEGICSMAGSATLLHYANKFWGTSLDNTINHMTGTTTLGKSSASALFVSLGSAPFGEGSLLLTFLSTANALLAQVERIWGYPVALDELSTAGEKELTWLVYALANGVGKRRCKAGGTSLSDDTRFGTVFLSNGEVGLIKHCKKNEGISVRVFEYNNIEWTRNVAEAKQIKAVTKDNFGFVTPLIAQELLLNGESWHTNFVSWQERTGERITNEKLVLATADRLADVVALYMTSCEIFNKVLQVQFDVEGVFDFFFTHIIFKNAEDGKMGIRAYESIMRHFMRNKGRYIDADAAMLMPINGNNNYMMSQEVEGLLVTASRIHKDKQGERYNSYIMFNDDVLEKILEDNRFPDARVTLKALHNEGLLKTKDSNRETMDAYLNDIKCKVYAVWYNDYHYVVPDDDMN